MEIRRLETSEEITLLAAYPDDVSDDPLLLCDYSGFVDWLAETVPQNGDLMPVWAAVDGAGKPIGYLVACVLKALPAYHYATIFRLSCRNPEATKALVEAAKDFAREREIPRSAVVTFDERAKEMYQRRFGLKHCGWQLHGVN